MFVPVRSALALIESVGGKLVGTDSMLATTSIHASGAEPPFETGVRCTLAEGSLKVRPMTNAASCLPLAVPGVVSSSWLPPSVCDQEFQCNSMPFCNQGLLIWER